MPEAAGVGFVDVGTGTPGTDSRQFTSATFVDWASVFYQRLIDQMRRASSSIGCDLALCRDICGRLLMCAMLANC